MNETVKKRSPVLRLLASAGKLIFLLAETVLILAVLLYGVMYTICKGPSETARSLFVLSVRETSAVGFLADWFFSADEIAGMSAESETVYTAANDLTVLEANRTDSADGSEENGTGGTDTADEWALLDTDGDGIIIEEVHGSGYAGYMMLVRDPSRVIMGCVPSSFGARGYSVEDMCTQFDAVAGINAGGFEDPNGSGNGSIPNSLVVYEGKMYYSSSGIMNGFVGLDADSRLHVGMLSAQEISERNIQYGVCFGPVLVQDGEMADADTLSSGLNPRTAIGQREDGTILLLVIDGRQVISLGATYTDVAKLMLQYGAVNALNLDGGSSTLMWYNGEYVNNCASVVGIRPVPTTFLVLKEGVNGND